MKSKLPLLMLILSISFGFAQKRKASFTNILNKGIDTLTFYTQQIYHDSIIILTKREFSKEWNYVKIQSFIRIDIIKKNGLDLDKKKLDNFDFRRSYWRFCTSNCIETLSDIENNIKSNDPVNTACDSQFIFYLFIRDKSYISKKRNCGQEVLNKMSEMLLSDLIPG